MRQCDFDEAKRIFMETKAIITGDHFVYAKKPDGFYHGCDYVNKDAIYPFVKSLKQLCAMIALHCKDMGIETVVGPTVGGALLTQHIAGMLINMGDSHRNVFAVFADEVNGERVIKRGYGAFVKGKRCLLSEDVINSGKTAMDTRIAIEQSGGTVVCIAALCNRSGGKVNARTLGVPELVSLLDVDMQMFKEEECPICKERGISSVRLDLGKGFDFLARKGAE